MRSLGELIVVNLDMRDDLALFDRDADGQRTIVTRLWDPSHYPPEKRILLALAVIDRLLARPS